jgi:hypothetical protein
MRSYENKNLLVPSHDDFQFQGRKYRKIILNDELDSVLSAIDHYWPPASEIVTSGIRVPDDSLRIIRQYLRSKGLDKKYPEAMTCDILDKGKDIRFDGDIYAWQAGWSALLNAGVIVNPPFEAVCLMDYFRNGINKKGQRIGQSPHVKKKAFDLSGTDSLTIVKRLVEDKMIRGFLLERENNCIHCDI